MAITWTNGSEVTVLSGGSVYETVVPSDTIDGIDRFDVGGRPSTEALNGYVRSVKFYNKHRSVAQIGKDMVVAGDYAIIGSGQSNMTGPFSDQSTSLNGGEKSGKAVIDAVWTSTRNWIINGATTGTFVRYVSGVAGSDNWWINEVTGDIGMPFQRWMNIAQGASNATFKAIIDVSGESDAGNSSKTDFKAAQLAKFNAMRAVIGNVPVIMVPIGRNTTADYTGYQTIREAQQELASDNPSWIHLAPERFDLPLSDNIHLSDAGNQTMMTRLMRKALSVLGETVSGSVNGPTITGAVRTGTSVAVTISHPTGSTDFTPTSGIEGFVFLDNSTPIGITAAVRTNATTITLTLNSTPSGVETLYCGRNALQTVNTANLVHGNSSQALPLRAAKITL